MIRKKIIFLKEYFLALFKKNLILYLFVVICERYILIFTSRLMTGY